MASISRTLARIKQELDQLIPAALIEQICRDLKHTYRKRKLDPLTTVHLFLQQVLNHNTAITHLPHLSKINFDPSAYCDARKRLPLKVLEQLMRRLAGAVRERMHGGAGVGCWLGHRTWLLDGSSCSMPDTPSLQKEFGQSGQQKPGCGFPVAHLLAMFDAHSGMLMEMIAAPLRTQDFSMVSQLHPLIASGDVVVADCAFCSFAHTALLVSKGIHAVLALHQHLVPPFDRQQQSDPTRSSSNTTAGYSSLSLIKQLGVQDQLVCWAKPKTKPRWMEQAAFDALPPTLTVRVLRYRVSDSRCRTHEVTLMTTLLDEKRYTKAKLARLFKQRWRVEQDLRDLKITLKMDVLKCKSPAGVRKELAAYAVVYNLVCVVRQQAATCQRVKPQRISFIDVLRWLQHAQPGEALPRFIVNPVRPGRHEPRAYKRRHKEYDQLNKPRARYKNIRQVRAKDA